MNKLETTDGGWGIYDFGKDLYLHHVDNEALIENVLVFADNGVGITFRNLMDEAKISHSSEQEYKISKVFGTGSLEHVGLKGRIPADSVLAKEWETKASNDLKMEQAREEQQRRAAKLEEERKQREQKAREEQEKIEYEKRAKAVEQLRADMNKKYGKVYVDALDKGQIIVGMHEDLVALLCNYKGANMTMKYDNGREKSYDIYAIRDVKTGYQRSSIQSVWIGNVRIVNHKVASVTYGRRWSR